VGGSKEQECQSFKWKKDAGKQTFRESENSLAGKRGRMWLAQEVLVALCNTGTRYGWIRDKKLLAKRTTGGREGSREKNMTTIDEAHNRVMCTKLLGMVKDGGGERFSPKKRAVDKQPQGCREIMRKRRRNVS